MMLNALAARGDRVAQLARKQSTTRIFQSGDSKKHRVQLARKQHLS